MRPKKIILIYALLGAVLIALAIFFAANSGNGIQINSCNFPEETLRSIAVRADKNRNGILSRQEADQVRELYLKKLQPQDIADILEYQDLPVYTNADFTFDFTGIEHFPNATTLIVDLADGEYFNRESSEEQLYVQTANLESIYALKKLKHLTLHEVELVTIDFLRFPDLEKVQLSGMYNMETLVFPGHSKVKQVWLSGNPKLTQVDLSRLPHLEQADIRDNRWLADITLGRNNATLTGLSLWDLPQLDSIDLSCCTDLETVDIRSSPLTGLNLENSPELQNIFLHKLSIQTLDLTGSPKLSELVIEYDAVRELLLADSNQITWVRWTDSDITEFPLDNLNPETLVGLDIQGTRIGLLDISPYHNLQTLYYDKETTTVTGDINHIAQAV